MFFPRQLSEPEDVDMKVSVCLCLPLVAAPLPLLEQPRNPRVCSAGSADLLGLLERPCFSPGGRPPLQCLISGVNFLLYFIRLNDTAYSTFFTSRRLRMDVTHASVLSYVLVSVLRMAFPL